MRLIVKYETKLLNYLIENLDMPKKRIKQYLKNGSIYINNTKITKYDYKIFPNMSIIIDTENKNSTFPFEIIFEDNYLIAVNKPSGLLTISTPKEKEKTLYHLVRDYLHKKNKHAKLFVIHRLDKDTSGIVLFAKDEKTKNKLQENWNALTTREYVGIIHGTLSKKEAKIIQYLKETTTNLVYVAKNKEGKEAITNYHVIKESPNFSLIKINIETGRKNQIRVAFASLNHPLVGDKKYGFSKDKAPRLYLHATKLKFYHPYLKKEILLETITPNEFKKIMK